MEQGLLGRRSVGNTLVFLTLLVCWSCGDGAKLSAHEKEPEMVRAEVDAHGSLADAGRSRMMRSEKVTMSGSYGSITGTENMVAVEESVTQTAKPPDALGSGSAAAALPLDRAALDRAAAAAAATAPVRGQDLQTSAGQTPTTKVGTTTPARVVQSFTLSPSSTPSPSTSKRATTTTVDPVLEESRTTLEYQNQNQWTSAHKVTTQQPWTAVKLAAPTTTVGTTTPSRMVQSLNLGPSGPSSAPATSTTRRVAVSRPPTTTLEDPWADDPMVPKDWSTSTRPQEAARDSAWTAPHRVTTQQPWTAVK